MIFYNDFINHLFIITNCFSLRKYNYISLFFFRLSDQKSYQHKSLLINCTMFTLLFATILLTLQQPTFAADDDMQCTEGFVMDLFCINRGTLLDAPSVVTPQNPEKHSVHCLVDVNVCVNSGYNILLPNPKFGQGSEPKFVRALTLDKTGNALVVKFPRENGVCSTCTGSGNITAGWRFTYIGKVIPQGDDVAMFEVKNIS